MRAGLALAATLLAMASAIGPNAHAQTQDASRFAADILHQRQPGDTTALTRSEAVAGLRELLGLAADGAVERLGAEDGFLGDDQVRIKVPEAFAEAYARLKPFGMTGPLDELEIAVNRAAEIAIRDAEPFVADAIARQSFDDALHALRGDGAPAAAALKESSRHALVNELIPVMARALAETRASFALEAAATRYAPALLRTDMNEMLLQHATAGALDGLFYYLAQEELAIRHDRARWSSESLRRVFGG